MYATLHRRTGPAPNDDGRLGDDQLAERRPGADQLSDSRTGEGQPTDLRLRQIGGPIELVVRLWTEPPADQGAFEVREDRALADAGSAPAAASVLTFTGPISPAVEAAAERAHRDRIAPAMQGHPGGVRQLSLWQPELRRVVMITLATSLDALEEGGKRIGSLPLLPGEDVALLPGPDHVEMFRVES